MCTDLPPVRNIRSSQHGGGSHSTASGWMSEIHLPDFSTRLKIAIEMKQILFLRIKLVPTVSKYLHEPN